MKDCSNFITPQHVHRLDIYTSGGNVKALTLGCIAATIALELHIIHRLNRLQQDFDYLHRSLQPLVTGQHGTAIGEF